MRSWGLVISWQAALPPEPQWIRSVSEYYNVLFFFSLLNFFIYLISLDIVLCFFKPGHKPKSFRHVIRWMVEIGRSMVCGTCHTNVLYVTPCLPAVSCHLGTGRSSAWSSPSRADPGHKHPPASVPTHSPWGSEHPPGPPEPCTAPSPPTDTSTLNLYLLFCPTPVPLSSHELTSDIVMVSSSPGRQGWFPVSRMDRPKSARTQDRSARTKTFLLVTSLWATAGLYWSEWGKRRGWSRLVTF